MKLQLPLQKEGQPVVNLKLNLNKSARFTLELYWKSKHDLDVHALLSHNDGNGAKISDLSQMLSTYNRKTSINPVGVLIDNPDKTFSTPCGALTHSGDCRDGIKADIDETVIIDGGKIQNGVNEIPIFVTIHPGNSIKFAEVPEAGIRIKDDTGKILGEYALTNEFAQFNAVQMGSLILGQNGWEYAAVGSGFMGDFNDVIGFFS